MTQREWWYALGRKRIGPLPEGTLRNRIRAESLGPDVLVWTDGMDDWEAAAAALPRFATAPTTAVSDSSDPDYFPVSTTKFIVMSVVTAGLYEFYWFYRNWKYLKVQRSQRVSPFWRAWFTLFFGYDLFRQIRDDARDNVNPLHHPGWLFIAYVLLTLSWRLPDPFWVLGWLSFLPLLPVVGAINGLNEHRVSPSKMNASFSLWNWLAIGLFVLNWGSELLYVLWLQVSPS